MKSAKRIYFIQNQGGLWLVLSGTEAGRGKTQVHGKFSTRERALEERDARRAKANCGAR